MAKKKYQKKFSKKNLKKPGFRTASRIFNKGAFVKTIRRTQHR